MGNARLSHVRHEDGGRPGHQRGVLVSMPSEREMLERRLEILNADPGAAANRLSVCDAVSEALVRLGQLPWVGGALIGGDRVSGASPFRFGSDVVAGLATVAQIGGQLSQGAIAMLKSGNLYAAEALVRQLVEVEYLAHAFAYDHTVSADWLRADRDVRRSYWTPAAVRSRADGAFPAADYWRHCDLGGHPTGDGRRLLPDHKTINVAFLWADLAGHLVRVWTYVRAAADQAVGSALDGWGLPDVDGVIAAWRATDQLTAALGELSRLLQSGEFHVS